MGRPIIGITSELDAARWGDWIREAAISPVSYIRAVERAGGAPLIVPPVPPASVAAFIEVVDGLVFTGGRDIDPALYDQERLEETDEPDQRRDRFELALMRAALEANVPFLAIGRGLHVLTLARGGTLTQDLPGHRAARARYTPHDVILGADSLLGRLLGTRVEVPAAHHQAPYHLGDGLTVTGWSPDGEVTEALEVARAPLRRRRPVAPGGGRRPAPARRVRRGGGGAPPGPARGGAAAAQAGRDEAEGGRPPVGRRRRFAARRGARTRSGSSRAVPVTAGRARAAEPRAACCSR